MKSATPSMIKFVMMLPTPISERWATMFCIDELAKRFDLEYWDCSPIAYINFAATNVLERPFYRRIDSIDSLKMNLRRLPKDVVIISHIHLVRGNKRLHKIISNIVKNRVYIDFWACGIDGGTDLTKPEPIRLEKPISFTDTLRHWLNNHYYLAYIVKRIKHRNDADFQTWHKNALEARNYLIAEDYYNQYLISTRPGSKYFINHADYEKYLSIRNNPPILDYKYVVYIDQYYPIHPTLKADNPQVDFAALRKPYYDSLNGFFAKVEQQLNCKVVIAAHPVADYSENPFDGRKIIYFKTAELIKDAQAVCMHTSFSISYVVLYNKPICFMSNEAFCAAPTKRRELNNYARVFWQPLCDIDQVKDVKTAFSHIPQNIREEYCNRFFDSSNIEPNHVLLENNIIEIHDEIVRGNTFVNSI